MTTVSKYHIEGSIPAIVTPMASDRSVDEKTFARLVELHIKSGSHGLVPVGTTGESPTLSHREHQRIIDICVEVSAGKLPVIPGTGSNSTQEAIELTKYAQKAGSAACLIVTPYYNKPNQEGLYQHYKSIAKATDIPIIIYNIPGRCVIKMNSITFGRLTQEMPDIFIGVKDATGDANNTRSLLSVVKNDFVSLCGDDSAFADFANAGSTGCISVIANIAPKLCARMHTARLCQDMVTFHRLNALLMPINTALSYATNPCAIKYAAMYLGVIPCDAVRLPLVTLSKQEKKIIDTALEAVDTPLS